MSVKCREITAFLDAKAPPELAESYDNVGLLVGSPDQDIKKVLVSLDVTGEVVKEAKAVGADMIVSHHPLLFKPMKRIRTDDPKGFLVHELIKNGISVYSAHTNLDVADHGVNASLADKLGLKNVRPLKEHYVEPLYKVVVFVPAGHAEKVRKAMCDEGAGWIGNYSDCSYMLEGVGTFKPLKGTHPFIGEEQRLERVDETRIETIVPASGLKKVLRSMLEAHPYEEAAYDVYKTEAKGKIFALGLAGLLEKPLKLADFAELVKKALDTPALRIVGRPGKGELSSVAVFCGSYDEDLGLLKRSGVDVLVTGDLKYHTASDAVAEGLCIVDAGHFNTEKLILPVLARWIQDRFSEVEVVCNSVEKDPFVFY